MCDVWCVVCAWVQWSCGILVACQAGIQLKRVQVQVTYITKVYRRRLSNGISNRIIEAKVVLAVLFLLVLLPVVLHVAWSGVE